MSRTNPVPPMKQEELRVCVVGAGTRFLSGITIYTFRLATILARSYRVSAILMRQLLPTRLYPGRDRVGVALDRIQMDDRVRVFDGIDWYWLPSMVRALAFLVREHPDVVVFEWWTGTVLHSYLLLAAVAKLLGARVVIEFHEVLDTGELKLLPARKYVRLLAPLLMRLADGFALHAEADLALLKEAYPLGRRPIAMVPHGPHDHYQSIDAVQRHREAPESCCNLLWFGVIREYKGLEDLIRAFNDIPEDRISHYWLTIVGETWEGYTVPAELMAQSPYRDRITFVNRYVRDDEVASFFEGADAVVLPYRRSCVSGPLHVAMGYGLPVVVTRVGGLAETVEDYDGALVIPPEHPAALAQALVQVESLRGRMFANPHSWEATLASYRKFFEALMNGANEMPSKDDRVEVVAR